jgi:hypothetical protein
MKNHKQVLQYHETEIKKELKNSCLCQCCRECGGEDVRSTWLWCHVEFEHEFHINHLCDKCCEEMKPISKSVFERYYEKYV